MLRSLSTPKPKFPFLAFLDFINRTSGETEKCTGSILNENWILTSASCCEGNELGNKIANLDKDRNFEQKSKFLKKIGIFSKNRNFWQQ